MKRFLIVLFVFLFLVIGGGVLWLSMNLDRLVEIAKPHIEKQLTTTLGAPTRLGGVHLKILPSPRIVIESLQIGKTKEESVAGQDGSLGFKSLELQVELLPLLSKELVISKLEILSPRVTAVKSAAGVQIVGLPPASQRRRNSEAAAESAARSPGLQGGEGTPQPLSVALQGIAIRDATITFIDQLANRTVDIVVDSLVTTLDLADNHILLKSLTAQAKIFGKEPFRFSGRDIGYSLADGRLTLASLESAILDSVITIAGSLNTKKLTGEIDLSAKSIKLAELHRLDAALGTKLSELALTGTVAPELKVYLAGEGIPAVVGEVQLARVGASAGGVLISELAGALLLSRAQQGGAQLVRSKDLQLKVGEEPVQAEIELLANFPQGIEIKRVNLTGIGGTTALAGRYGLESKSFSTVADINTLELGRILKAVGKDLPVSGNLTSAKVDLTGSLQGEPLTTLKGSGSLVLTDGVIRGQNILADILTALRTIPGIDSGLDDLSDDPEATSNDTAVKELSARFLLGAGSLNLQELNLLAPLFDLGGTGTMKLPRGTNSAVVDLNTQLALTAAASKKIADRSERAKKLLNEEERLELPLVLRGTLPKIAVLPDLSRLMKTAAGKELEDRATKALDKALGKEGSADVVKGLKGVLGF